MFKLSPDCVVFFVSVVFLVAAVGNCRRPSPPRPGATCWPSAAHQRHRPDATGVARRRDEPRQDEHAHNCAFSLSLSLSCNCILTAVFWFL